METMTKFEPKLLQRNDERIARSITEAKQNADLVTEDLSTISEFIGLPLSDSEKLDLLSKKDFEEVMDQVRAQYQFPNATDAFNLEAMGKDASRVERAYKRSAQLSGQYAYDIKDSKAELSKEAE